MANIDQSNRNAYNIVGVEDYNNDDDDDDDGENAPGQYDSLLNVYEPNQPGI
jgi:hypothetical protein